MIPLKEDEVRALVLLVSVLFLAYAIIKINRSGLYWD